MNARGQAQRRAVLRRREERARLVKRAEDWCGDDRVAVAVLPANEGRTTRLPERRHARFAEHLRQLVEELERRATKRIRGQRAKPTPAEPDTESRVLGQACATCRGHCCRSGGDNAFLDTSDLARFWSTRPKATGASIVQAYLSALPDLSYAGSCVFHARTGCSLPREMRANLCNVFLCDGLRELRNALDGGTTRGAFLAAAKDGELLRATRVAPDGTTKRARKS